MRRVVGWVGGVAGTALAVLAAAAVLPAIAQTGGFEDVAAGAYYSAPVEELAGLGVLTGCEGSSGFDDSRFCPDDPMDRKTMAVWVVRVLEGEDPPPGMSRFPDANALGAFWAPFIEQMAELGITVGCGDGTDFCPNDEVTRAQAAVFLSRAFDLPDGPDPGFSDVPDGAWYYDEAAALAASGITVGCGDGTMFCPHQATSRAQMATFLSRARQLTQAAADATSPTPENSATSVGGSSSSSGGGGAGGGGGQGTTTTPVTRAAVTVSFGAMLYTATEGGTAATVRVELSADPERTVEVPLTVTRSGGATSGDYTLSATRVTFAADQDTTTFTVTAINDSIDDDGESLTIGFGQLPEGVTAAGHRSATVALADNDVPQVTASFGQSTYEAAEGGSVLVSVELSEVPERPVTVDLTVTGNAATSDDYRVSSTSVTFAADQRTATFTVAATDDSVDDDDESVTIGFGQLPEGVTAVSPRTATVSLIDGDVTPVDVSFVAGPYTAAEGGGAVTVTLSLSAAPGRSVDVPLRVIGGTATTDDYTLSPSEVTFAANQQTATFRVTAFDDSVDDDNESVKIGFGTLPVGMTATSPTSIEVALVDNDDPQVTVSFEKDSYTAREGSDAVTVTVKLSADPEREVMVPLSVTRGGGAIPADYEVSPMELTFGDGQTTADFEVTAVDDDVDDDGETVTIRFGTLPNKVTAANPRAAQVFLDDDDDPLGRVTMRLPAGCVLRDLITGNEMPYASYYSGCASLHIPRRNAHYYRLVVRQEGAVTLAVSASTASHLLIRSASGEVIARYDEPGEIEFYQLSLTRTLEAGTYVIEVAAQWSHFSDHGRGHTLRYSGSTIARPGAYKLAGLSITDVNLAHFAAGTTEYSRNIAADVRTVTVTPTATLDDAEVTVMPPDANASLGGRQVDLEADGVTEVTVAVKSPMIVDAETMYRVVLTQLAGTTAPLSDDPGLVSLSFEGIDIGDFSSDKTGYTYPLGFYERLNGTTVTMSVTPAGGATWTANRSDEDEDVDGHQLSIDGDDVILVTVTSQDNANTRVYRVAPEAPVTRDASKDICTSCEVRYPYGLWSDGESMITMSRPANTLHVFDIETKRQQSTLRLTRPRYNGWNADESKGFWTDGETVWVLHQEDDDWEPNDNNVLYAYSLETQARIPASDIQFPDEWGSPTALWIDGERMYMATFWDVLHIYEFSADASDIDTIRYDSGHPDGPPGGNTLAIWSDGTTLYLAIDNAWVRAYDAESGRRIPGLDFRTSPHPTNTNWSHPEPIGIWSDGRTMWVIDVARGYPEAYSMLENARLWKLSVSGGDIGYFHNGKFDYDVEVPAGTTSIAITAEAAFGGGSSSVVFSGTDADDQTHGHQATLAPGEDTAVTITVTAPNGTDTEVYTVRITHAS